jgi:hypothetical protein
MDAILAALARGSITHLEFAVGIALSRFADSKSGESYPSIRAIAEKIGAKADKRGGCARISAAIATLKREGILEVRQRHNRSSVYRLTGGVPIEIRWGVPIGIRQPNPVNGSPPLTKSGDSQGEDQTDDRARRRHAQDRNRGGSPRIRPSISIDKWLGPTLPQSKGDMESLVRQLQSRLARL